MKQEFSYVIVKLPKDQYQAFKNECQKKNLKVTGTINDAVIDFIKNFLRE